MKRILGCSLLLAAVISAQTNPRIGKWKLKSDAPPPAINIMTYEPYGSGGMKVTVHAVNAQGRVSEWTYNTMFDGKDERVSGDTRTETTAFSNRHPLWLLAKKELRLQQLAFVVAGLYFPGSLSILSLSRLSHEQSAVFDVLTTFYTWLRLRQPWISPNPPPSHMLSDAGQVECRQVPGVLKRKLRARHAVECSMLARHLRRDERI